MNFSSKPLRGYMAEEGISYDRLSEICGISITSVRRLCSKNIFTSDVLLKVCKSLNLGIGDVIRLEDEEGTVPLVTKPNPYVECELTPEEVANDQLQRFLTAQCVNADCRASEKDSPEDYRNGFYDCADSLAKFKPVF